MRLIIKGLLLLSAAIYTGCNSGNKGADIYGTWQSLWQKDMTLQLELREDGRFKVTLDRYGQVHNNLGWYSLKDSIFNIRDSVDYPLPVCNTFDTGRYHVKLHQDSLQFILITDKCEKRSNALQLDRFVKLH